MEKVTVENNTAVKFPVETWMVGLRNLMVFGKSLFQPEHRILEKALEEQLPKEAIIRLFDNQDEIMQLNLSPIQLLEEMAKNQAGKSDIGLSLIHI